MIDDPYLAGLTEAQAEAVAHDDGPLLVLAGAGSGKTRVITRRAARLARRHGADCVMAITFTNKAAAEMRERIAALGQLHGMWVYTFHAVCARILRRFAGEAGLTQHYSIFDTGDRHAVIRQAIEDCNLRAENWRPALVEHVISRAKNQLQTPDGFEASARDFSDRTLANVYRRYEALMSAQNAVDFDDLLMKVAVLLRDRAEITAEITRRFRHILVDEYQDTNGAQYVVARQLSAAHRNICVSGDPDQSIYGWRGANIENILGFERDFPDARIVRLEQNFRSTKRILSIADRLISHNVRRKAKRLWTQNDAGPAVRLWYCPDEHDEIDRIARDIANYRAGGGQTGDVAIFYRTTALTRVLESGLRRAGLPYVVARGVEFYNRKEIKDALAYLRLLVNPADEIAAVRAMGAPPRGIGKTTTARLCNHAREQRITIRAAIAGAAGIETVKSARGKIALFDALLTRLEALPTYPTKPLLEAVIRNSGMESDLSNDPDPDKPALTNVNELVSAAAEYDAAAPDGSLTEWLSQVSLANDTDALNAAGGAITLMTLHAAKGLEFPLVYIVGMEEGLLPHERVRRSNDDLEEERRLLFVGITRAMQRLTLTRAEYRMSKGATQRTLASSFLAELPRDEIDHVDYAASHSARYDERTSRARQFDDGRCRPGRLVRHPHYGAGVVIRSDLSGMRRMVTVRFEDVGEKTFILDHVDLEVAEQ